MTSKLKCPVCNVPLTACGDLLSCPNDHCAWVGNAELWRALIQAQKDIKRTKKQLKTAKQDFKLAMDRLNQLENELEILFI